QFPGANEFLGRAESVFAVRHALQSVYELVGWHGSQRQRGILRTFGFDWSCLPAPASHLHGSAICKARLPVPSILRNMVRIRGNFTPSAGRSRKPRTGSSTPSKSGVNSPSLTRKRRNVFLRLRFRL